MRRMVGSRSTRDGFTELLDSEVAEDCGTMVNPMTVGGQIRGGVM
jgi:CO/xanthine dehydrogenase Mo-binding subunit